MTMVMMWLFDGYHLLPMCYVCIKIRIKVFGIRVLVTVLLETPFYIGDQESDWIYGLVW
jgi:hypothetical protein